MEGFNQSFVKQYLDDILFLYGIPVGESTTLLALLQRADEKNEFVINAALKRIIAKDIDRSVNTINSAITQFVKTGIIERIDTGLYRLNSSIFGGLRHSSAVRIETKYRDNERIIEIVFTE